MKITCQNCKHTENIELFEYRKNSKMYLTKVMFSFKDLDAVKPSLLSFLSLVIHEQHKIYGEIIQ